jgi:isoleucyl-tRNA synthetase
MDSLKEIFNVSAVRVDEYTDAAFPPSDLAPSLDEIQRYQPASYRFVVRPATGHKCARCWNFMPEVSNYGIWQNVCTRCQSALKEMGIDPPQPQPTEVAS